jgi:hypothetical protein
MLFSDHMFHGSKETRKFNDWHIRDKTNLIKILAGIYECAIYYQATRNLINHIYEKTNLFTCCY